MSAVSLHSRLSQSAGDIEVGISQSGWVPEGPNALRARTGLQLRIMGGHAHSLSSGRMFTGIYCGLGEVTHQRRRSGWGMTPGFRGEPVCTQVTIGS